MIVTALLFALPLLLLTVACKSVEPRYESEVIPDSLGAPEGLWLYKGNLRSRTDGTEEEALLTSLTVGETEYGAEDFKIVSYQYISGTYEVFYIIQIESDCRLCHYNYFTKESSDLYDLPDTEDPQDYKIKVSNSLVYVVNEGYPHFGVIFSRTAELLHENFYGELDGDCVYANKNNTFEYYIKGGEKHAVPFDDLSYEVYQRCGKYVYLFGSKTYAINLETEECTELSLFNAESDMEYRFEDFYCVDGSLFVIILFYRRNSDNDDRIYKFIRVTGGSAAVAYDFGDVPNGVTMLINGSTIYLVKGDMGRWWTKYYAYDCKTGTTKKVSQKTVKSGKSTDELKKEAAATEKELVVGEYSFYVTSIGYDRQSGFMTSYYAKTCYYLMRRYGSQEEEVMQYSLDKNNGYFFDDIREF